MVKLAFTENLRLSKTNQERLELINKIIEEYAEEGYKLTLRQLYYQLVSRDIIANRVQEYAKLSTLLVKARMAGVVDWDAIEDRLRRPFLPYWVTDVEDAIQDTVRQYRLDRQEGQEVYIELWVEKDALSGVLKRITSKYHINLMVNRGYSSLSAMYDAFNRFMHVGKKTLILYLGDHDPSGLDMVRDIRERLQEFGMTHYDQEDFEEAYGEGDFTIKHIGLTKEQIEQYNPPPNPAKLTDPRAKAYIREHGPTSWEVDALNPQVLHELVSSNVEDMINMDLFDEKIIQEEKDKKTLSSFGKSKKEGD